ncbi:MAG TPA: LamG-like jellyroll fold domain-containing protein, partial [Anaerolineae bacterium]|nr:LamG-like jellyroll fold domain-containing protein [Anaerolineae bacterium]
RNGIYEAAPTTVAINVMPNTAPIAQTDVYTTYQVVPLYMDVVANDMDGEMNGLTPMVVTPPVTGTLVVTGTNQLLYTPVMTGPAVVTFTYQAYDGALSSAPTMVTINVETASPVDLLACNMPAVTFEAGLPSEWVSVVNTGLFTWTTTADTACAWGNETPGTGEAACADADQFNEARLPYDLDLMTNPFNLPGEGNATLRFGYYLETYEIGSILDADILVDGSWHNVWWITGYYQSNGEAEIDLSPYLGESDLQLRFKYSGEDWDYAAMVDDVSLDCQLTATNTVNDEAQLTKAISTTHVFYWDTFASGFFGQSDDVLVRLELYEQDNTKPVTGTYSYPNLAPAETLHPYATTTSSPFRVRGTQIRVFGDGPDAAWPLDEITGTVAIEANGSGYDGSLLTGTTFTTDTAPVNYPNASAVAFNGIDEPLFVPSIPIVNRTVTPERAISVWFKADDVTINDRKQVIFEAGGAVNGLSIYLYDGELYAGAYMESGGVSGWGGDWVTTTQVESGQWHHLVWQMFGDDLVQADRMSLYLDGELVGTAPGMQTYNHPNANSLGGINGDTKFHDVGDVTGPGPLAHLFVGVIDELRVYNRLLTPAEIRQLAEGEPLYSVTAPVANARIYRLPAGQTTNGTLLTDSAGLPLVSDNQGYLQGQAQLAVGDQLMAMVPITVTDAYTLYYTSGTPITTGLDLDNVNNPGTQNLTVSSAKPLLLFNLDVSLEWDATNDDLFLDTLATVLGYSSDVLYDVSNGQAALGDVRLYQNRENWHEADILLYAANDIHPSATMGGVVDDPVHDIGLTGVITNAYRPGLIRMGSNWDPFGEGQADFTQEWWQALTHELGHYLFFMPDNYIGADEGGILATDCIGSFMTTSYDDAYSEFLPEADWIGDCLLTLAAQTTGRPDWETITTFYPMLNAPASRFENSGPTVLPLAMTAVTMVPPAMDNGIQAGGNYTLRAADTGQVVTVPQARGYLRQTRGTADLSDDGIIPLGVTNAGGDRLKVRGAAVGDEVCIVDTSRNPAYLGCETVDSLSSSIDVYTVAGWQPNILVKSITSETLAITVTQYVSSAMMNVQVLPAYGLPGRADLITSTWGALTVVDPLNPVTFTGQIDLDYLTFEGTVRVWVPGTVPTQQAFTDFAISLDAWGGESAIWGGESAIWGGESAIWGGPSRPWGAPSVSTDGQLVILNFDDPYGPTGIGSMQSLASVPTLPAWLTVVGDAYNVQLRPGFTANVTRTIAIDYLQRQTPDGYEHTLTMYYSPDYGKTWLRLPTRLDTEENRAVAFMDNNQPEGLYALIATVRMSPFTLGWNLFGYPINETRPITSALASIDGSYNSVYHYDAYTGQWLLYDAVVAKNYADYAGLVNTLDNLEYGLGYWLYATEPITLFLGVPTDNGNSLTEPVNGLFAFPPMTIFGPVWSTAEFVPTAGMTIEAYVNDVLCGTGTLVEWQGALAYQLQVKANSGDGCGLTGATVHFAIDGQMLWGGEAVWDSSQAQYHPLTAAVCVAPSTPMVAGEVVGLDILLSWADVGASGYEVWVQDGPYAAAGADCATAANCELVSGLGYVDEGGVVVGEARWYQVGAVASCGVRGDVAEVGVMTIEIVGGE